MFQVWACKQVMEIAPDKCNMPWEKELCPLCPSYDQIWETCSQVLFYNHADWVEALRLVEVDTGLLQLNQQSGLSIIPACSTTKIDTNLLDLFSSCRKKPMITDNLALWILAVTDPHLQEYFVENARVQGGCTSMTHDKNVQRHGS